MQISGIKFTTREIDVISCILNIRSRKKIALILSISPKTVDNHIQNILLKINRNSKEAIIDFIEKSKEYKIIKDHYINFLIQVLFERQLKNISQVIKSNNPLHVIIKNQSQNNGELQFLTTHLETAGINIIKNNDGSCPLNKNCLLLNILTEENIEPTINNILLDGLNNNLFIIINNNIEEIIIEKNLEQNILNYILDFSNKKYYWTNFIKLLELLLINIDCNKFLVEMRRIQLDIVGSNVGINEQNLANAVYNDDDKTITAPVIEENKDRFNTDENSTVKSNNINNKLLDKFQEKKFLLIILSIFISCLFLYLTIDLQGRKIGNINIATAERIKIVQDLDDFLAKIKTKELSADNVSYDRKNKNYECIKKVEKILIKDNQDIIRQYFINGEANAQEIADFIYNLHAIAHFYFFNDHDGTKSKAILNYAKNLIENYINSLNKLKLNFDKITKEQIFIELSIVKNMPELYCRIMYGLGRTYFYSSSNQNEALKYFETARYLGKKLNLFEGYLSGFSGINLIKYDSINENIKNKKFQDCEQQLRDLISSYNRYSNDNLSYRKDYKPNDSQIEFIIPAQNNYNILESKIRMIKCYTKLILITDSVANKLQYLNEIIKYLSSDSLGISIHLANLSHKKQAAIYNDLAFMLLTLYENEPKIFESLINYVTKMLKLSTDSDPLNLIEKIFTIAEHLSRNTEFTKADSYDGLIKIYNQKIMQPETTNQDKELLTKKIQELSKKRNYINSLLNRTYSPW